MSVDPTIVSAMLANFSELEGFATLTAAGTAALTRAMGAAIDQAHLAEAVRIALESYSRVPTPARMGACLATAARSREPVQRKGCGKCNLQPHPNGSGALVAVPGWLYVRQVSRINGQGYACVRKCPDCAALARPTVREGA